MSGSEVRLDKESARLAAQRLTRAGTRAAAAWARMKAQIEGIHGRKPWGNDEPGKEFDKNYTKGGAEGPAPKALEAGDKLIVGDAKAVGLKGVGPIVQSAIEGTISADELTAKLFKSGGSSA
jgi:hypothetical protein